jgi:hypothetical protein
MQCPQHAYRTEISPEYLAVENLRGTPVPTQRRREPGLGKLLEEAVGQDVDAQRVGKRREGAEGPRGVTLHEGVISAGPVCEPGSRLTLGSSFTSSHSGEAVVRPRPHTRPRCRPRR